MKLLACLALVAPACTGAIDNGGGTNPPPPTDVQVTVRDGAKPAANVRVIFQDASDALIEEVMTDVAGTASAEMPTGGSLSVIRVFPMPMDPNEQQRVAEVHTYVGIKAGDRIELGDMVAEGGIASAINVVVPTTAVGTVTVETPCGTGTGTAPNVPIAVTNCPAQVPFYVMDSDGSSFAAMAPFSTSVDLSVQTFVTSLSSSISAQNVPLDTTIDASKSLVMGNYTLYTSATQRIDQTTQNIDVPQLTNVDQVVTARIQSQGRTQMTASRKLFAPGPTIIDAGFGMIQSVSMQPNFTLGQVSWMEEGIALADAVIVELAVTREIQMGQAPGPQNQYIRRIVSPWTGLTARIPVLPNSGVIYNPLEQDSVGLSHGLVKVTGGYDALRGRVFSVNNVIDLAPVDGFATLSYVGQPPTRE